MESSKTANTTFDQAVIKAKVAQICDHVGYHAISQDSSNILASIYQLLIRNLARYCKEAANNNYRSESTLNDLVQACDIVGISVPSLQEHIETVKLPLKVELQPADDDSRPSNRIQRNLLVDDLLESEKNNNQGDQTNGVENQPGTTLEQPDEEADKPLVPLLKDTYQEITSKFAVNQPVTADKKIRLGGRIVLPLFTKLKLNATIPTEPSTSGFESKASKKEKEKRKKIDRKKVDRKKAAVIPSTDSPSLEAAPKTKKGDRKKKIERKKAESNSELPKEPPLEIPIKVEEQHDEEEQQQQEQKQVIVKVKKEEKKNKKMDKKDKVVPAKSRQPTVRQTKGKRAKKLSREFILPEDDIDDELLGTSSVAPTITPLDLTAAEPPSFLPILDVKSESDAVKSQQETTLTPPPPGPPPPTPPPTKGTTSLLSSSKEKSTNVSKQQKSKSKNKKSSNQPKTHITPLDPAIAEPPSFFPILDTTLNIEPNLTLDEPIKTFDKPSTSLLKIPEPSATTTSKQPKSKKKKKSSGSQFAIVSETVVSAEEKEWFCPACGGPDDGDLMVQCDKCQEWYHLGCTTLHKPPDDDEHWECEICINKIKASQKKSAQPTSVIISPKIPTSNAQIQSTAANNVDEHSQKQLKTPETIQVATSLLAPRLDSSITPSPTPLPTTTTVLDPDLCPECSLADDGTMMIQCDDPFCARWFHGKCVNLLEEPKEDESWFCKACVEKQQSAFKRRRRK